MFEGDWNEGELEIGQVAAQIDAITPVAEIVQEFVEEYTKTLVSIREIDP